MADNMRLTCDHTVTEWGSTFTLPAGTEIMAVCRGVDMHTPLYAVKSSALLIELSGNNHDPKYRYCFVPPELIENRQD